MGLQDSVRLGSLTKEIHVGVATDVWGCQKDEFARNKIIKSTPCWHRSGKFDCYQCGVVFESSLDLLEI